MPSISLPAIGAAITAAMPAVGAIGAVVGAVGTVAGGLATANAAKYNAMVAQNNAKIAGQNADYAIKAGQAKATQQALQEAAQGGQIKAAQAATGVDVNSGSALDVQKGQREKGLLDVQTVVNNSELQAYGYKTQQSSFLDQAKLDTMEAQQAPIGADLSAAGGLLSNVSALSLKWSPTSGGSPSSSGSTPWTLDTATAPTG